MKRSGGNDQIEAGIGERQPVFIALHPTQRMGKAKSGISGDNAVDRQLPPKRAVGGPEIERAGKAAIDRAQPDEQLLDHVVAQERMSMKTLRRPVAAQTAQRAIKRLGDIHASAMTRQWRRLTLSPANAFLRLTHGRS